MSTADGRELQSRAWRGLTIFLAATAALIFLPAWSLAYWQGWLYWLVVAAATTGITVFFLARDPELIRRRLAAGAETEPAQKAIQAIASLMLIATLAVSSLDHRFGWSQVPTAVTVLAAVAVAAGFGVVFLTFRANSFASATVTVETGQRVITGGPYALVRHPMYSGAALLFLATPPALDSWWGGIPAIGLGLTMVARLLDEERFLAARLGGYDDYRRRTRYRLVPGVW